MIGGGAFLRGDDFTFPELQSGTAMCMTASVEDRIDMTRADRLNIRCLGWADLLTTGIDERQLRGAIDRGLIELGEKARNGRLMFSISERFTVQIIRDLTQLWIPIKQASYIARHVSARFETLLNYQARLGAQKQGDGALSLQVTNPESGLSIRFLVGNEVYKPGRGVTGEIIEPETAVIVCLSGILNDMWNWSNSLSHSSVEEEN
jgi:hypothetical protein